MEEREGVERRTGNLVNKLQELFLQLGVTMGMDLGQPSPAAFEKLMNRVNFNVKEEKTPCSILQSTEKNIEQCFIVNLEHRSHDFYSIDRRYQC